MRRAALLVALAFAACKRPAPGADAAPAPSAPPSASSAAVVPRGPAQDAGAAAREDAVVALLFGGQATGLADRATDPSKPFDDGLRDKLAPTVRGAAIRESAIDVSAGLPSVVVSRILRQNFGRFRLCYEKGLETRADLAGTVETKFAISADGSVTSKSAVVSGGTLTDAGVRSCVRSTIDNVSFPQPEGTKSVSVTFTLSFAPPG